MQFHVSSGEYDWNVEANTHKQAVVEALSKHHDRIELGKIIVVTEDDNSDNQKFFNTTSVLDELEIKHHGLRLVDDEQQGDGK